MEQSVGLGLALGLLVGLANEKVTQLCLARLLRRELLAVAALRWIVLMLVIGLYVLKYCVLGLGLYKLFVAVDFSLLWFGVGILAYQVYRVSMMIFRPRTYIAQRQM
jgi:hypothetical protein